MRDAYSVGEPQGHEHLGKRNFIAWTKSWNMDPQLPPHFNLQQVIIINLHALLLRNNPPLDTSKILWQLFKLYVYYDNLKNKISRSKCITSTWFQCLYVHLWSCCNKQHRCKIEMMQLSIQHTVKRFCSILSWEKWWGNWEDT